VSNPVGTASPVKEGAAAYWDQRADDDHWQQPGDLFQKMSPAQKQTLFDKTARYLAH
jgi:catalase